MLPFSAIPEDGRRAAYAEAQAKAKAEEEARTAAEKAREAVEAAKKLEKEVKKLSEKEAQAASLAEEAQEKAEAAGASIEGLFKDIGSGFSWDKLSAQLATTIQNSQEKEETERGRSNVSHARSRGIGCPQSKKLPNGSGTRVQVHRTHPKTATGGTLSDVSSVFFFL